MKRFEGKVVLISGTGGGQGRVAALRFAREGAIVVGCDTNSEEHAKTAQLMEAEGYSLHGSAPIDLGDHEHVVVDGPPVADTLDTPDAAGLIPAGAPNALRREPREAGQRHRLFHRVDGRPDHSERPDVRGFLDRALEHVGKPDHGDADARARGDHLLHVRPAQRAVLHLEEDVVVVGRDLAVELGVGCRDGVGEELSTVEQLLFRRVVQGDVWILETLPHGPALLALRRQGFGDREGQSDGQPGL